MKRIFTLFAFSACAFTSKAQLLVDNFDYSGDLANNGWSIHSGTADPILTTTGLTFSGYPGSGVGNAANVVGAGYDYNRGFAEQSGNGTVVWLSAMIRITEAAATTGGYFLHLGDRTSETSFSSFTTRVYAKTSNAGEVNFGIVNSNATPVYGVTNFATNTTYLLVVKYTINTGGNDEASLWILNTYPSDEASLGTPESTNSTAGTDVVDAVALRQAASIPDVVVDGLRVSNSFPTTVLPINLTSFKASLVGGKATLNWSSVNESNVKGFSIEKSLNGTSFTEINFVNATNRSSNTYAATDNNVKPGVNYYRLKMVDMDGSVRYSNVLSLSVRNTIKTEVFPNPAVNNITVSHDLAVKGAIIRILSMEGRQIKSIIVQPGAQQTGLSVNELVKGNYLLVYESNGEKVTSKFSKQ